MKRAIKTEIIVECGENRLASLVEAVGIYLQSKGFSVAIPHVYPEDPLIVEIKESIPPSY